MALSCFVNWQYDIVFGTHLFAAVDSIAILGVSIGSVNPIIGSAFQLLLLVYTAMAHKFSVKPVQKTAEQLKQEADELEAAALQQARIDAVKRSQSDSKLDGLFDTLGKAKDRAKGLISRGQNEDFAAPKEDPKPEIELDPVW